MKTTTDLPAEITQAISSLLYKQSFFASILFDALELRYDPACPTAATDGKTIYFGDWFLKLSPSERLFVLAHEISHYIYDHLGRARMYTDLGCGPDMKPFNAKLYNVAADYNINSLLESMDIGVMPKEGLISTEYTHEMVSDEIYVKLAQDHEDEDPQHNHLGEEHGGLEAGHGGFDEHILPAQAMTQAEKAELERVVTNAANAAKAQGNLPGQLASLVEELLSPKLDWKQTLKMQLINSSSSEDNDWARPNRKNLAYAAATGLPAPVMPRKQGFGCGRVVVQVDTSGSIGRTEAAFFLGGIREIAADCNPDYLAILFTDGEVAEAELLDAEEMNILDELDSIINRIGTKGLPGGGGTDMRAGFKYAREWGLDPDTMVTLTDGYTPWDDTCEFYHLAVVTEQGKVEDVPFGHKVFLDISN